jgi:hypothetical protein
MSATSLNGHSPVGAVSAEGRTIHAALAAARSEFRPAAKDGSNPHLKNRYVTFSSILEACEAALGRHGLSFIQPIVQTPTGLVLRTVLVHSESGERIESDCPLLFDTTSKLNPMQALGSAITYARRYGLESLLGLMREDDEGEGAFPRRLRSSTASTPALPARRDADRVGHAGTEIRPRQPFGVWVRSAAEQLGVNDERLIEYLHKEAVDSGRMATVEPDVRGQALARRYHDSQKGAEWRDWMRAECKAYQARLHPQPH